MARATPLLPLHQQAEALLETYGPTEAGIELVQTFGEVDLEYSAIRKGCGLFDQPQRATIEVGGADRIEFLNRMLTQELKKLEPFAARRSFWLSRKGRIDADLRVVNLPERVLLDVDAHAAARVLEGLAPYIIADDCTLSDKTEMLHRLSLHGPSACALLAKASTPVSGEAVETLRPGRVSVVGMAGAEVVVDRDDSLGEIGLELLVPVEFARGVWERLLEVGFPGGGGGLLDADGRPVLTTAPFHMRPVGWAACNIARIEAGSASYYLDFGPDSLPHESGVIDSRVSFTKGCYLGQEIVARMQSLGSPKQKVACLRLPTPAQSTGSDPTAEASIIVTPQPVTGAAIFAMPLAPPAPPARPTPSDCGEPIGAITSSAISPMLGGAAVCFAMVKTKHAAPGTALLVECEGTLLPTTVQGSLRSWSRAGSGG